MANITINQVCNLGCKYCFANEFVNNDMSQEMSFENFKISMEYHRDNDQRVGLIGGEPTIHSRFTEFIEYALEVTQGRGNVVQIFSNGIELSRYWKSLIPKRVNVLLNYNGIEICGKEKFDKLEESIRALHEDYNLGDRIVFGINLYSPDMDISYILKTLKRYNKTSCRVSVTVPNTPELRSLPVHEYQQRFKPLLLRFISQCAALGIKPVYDCNRLSPCLFTQRELEILNTGVDRANGEPLYQYPKCEPVLDIQPDLYVVRCFGMSDMKKIKLTSFSNLKDIHDVFQTTIDTLASLIPIKPECVDCIKYITGTCYGGCLGYKFEKLKMLSCKVGVLLND